MNIGIMEGENQTKRQDSPTHVLMPFPRACKLHWIKGLVGAGINPWESIHGQTETLLFYYNRPPQRKIEIVNTQIGGAVFWFVVAHIVVDHNIPPADRVFVYTLAT